MTDFSFALDIPPGIVKDDTTFASSGTWADGNCVRFREGRAETIGNIRDNQYTGLGGSVSAILGVTRGTSSYLYFGSTTELNVTQITTGVITNISPATLGTVGDWSLQMYGSYLLASPSGGKLYQYTGAGVATAVTAAPAKITTMLVNGKRQVLAFGCNEVVSGAFNGRCIRISDLEDYSSAGSWTTQQHEQFGRNHH